MPVAETIIATPFSARRLKSVCVPFAFVMLIRTSFLSNRYVVCPWLDHEAILEASARRWHTSRSPDETNISCKAIVESYRHKPSAEPMEWDDPERLSENRIFSLFPDSPHLYPHVPESHLNLTSSRAPALVHAYSKTPSRLCI